MFIGKIPQDAVYLERAFQSIIHATSLAARISAVAIPIFAALHVPYYLLRAQALMAVHMVRGDFTGGCVAFSIEASKAFEALVFSITSIAWATWKLFLETPSEKVGPIASSPQRNAYIASLFSPEELSRIQAFGPLFFNRQLILEALSKRFGPSFIEEVSTFYPSQPMLWNQDQLISFMVGVASNLTFDAATHYFKTEDEAALIESISTFRTATLGLAERLHLPQNWQKQFIKDFRVLDRMQSGEAQTEDIFSCSEFLARRIVYRLFDPRFSLLTLKGPGVTQFKEGMVISLSTAQNLPRLYTIHQLVGSSGVYGIILTPTHAHENDEGFIVFRGTHDAASIARDLNPFERTTRELWIEGPGGRSFNEHQHEILTQCQAKKKGIKRWNFIGHSLGGSDAARLLSTMVHSETFLDDAKEVRFIGFNAPHVDRATNKRFFEGVKRRPDCNFSIFHLEAKNDLVSSVGSSPLASKPTHPLPNLSFQKIVFTHTFPGFNPKAWHDTPWLLANARDQIRHRETLLRAIYPLPDQVVA